MIYCTLLNPALDVIYKTDEFHAGSTSIDTPVSVIPAGKGINVARVVKILGEDVCVTGLMPENDEKRVVDFLEHQSIKYKFFKVEGNLRVNTTIIERSTNSTTHLNAIGANVSNRTQDEFFDCFRNLLCKDDLWCYSGSIPNGFDNDIYGRMIKAGSKTQITSLLDTRGKPLKFGVRSRPTMIKPNLSELEEFFGEQIKGVHHIALKGKRLIDMGIQYVFISLGEDGLIAIHENDCLLCSAPQIKSIDTVGCGDALVAGLLVAHARKFSFSEMCRMAVACGTAKSLHEGPGFITRDEVWQLMEEVTIASV